MEQQTIAEVMDVPKASIVHIEKFQGVNDPDLKKSWCLVDGMNRELSVLYVCTRTGHFLASERLSRSGNINPLEYTKEGKFVGISRRYDIKGKRRV